MKQINKTRRLTALLLALVMLFSLAPTALAEDTPAAPPYSASVSEVNFGSAAPGYEVGAEDGKVKPVSIIVTKAGEQGPQTLTVSLVGSNTGNFTVNPDSISVSDGNQSQYTPNIEIKPNTGLDVGEYSTMLSIKSSEDESDPGITIPISFKVEASSGCVPVTNITGVPTDMTAGTSLTLTGTVEPDTATNKTIAWSLESAGTTAAGAVVNNGVLTATGTGTVKVRATIENGTAAGTPYTQDFSIAVADYVPVTNIKDVPTDMTVGTSLTLTGTVEPSNATNQTITWSLESTGNTGASLSNGVLSATSAGTVRVKATVAGGAAASAPYEKIFAIGVSSDSYHGSGVGKSTVDTVKIWDKVLIDGKEVDGEQSIGSASEGTVSQAKEQAMIQALKQAREQVTVFDVDGGYTIVKKVPPYPYTFDENGNLIVKVITVMPDGSGWVSAAPTEERPSQEAIDALFGKKVNMDLIGTADFQVYDVNENSPNVVIKLEPEDRQADGQADRETLSQSVQDLMREAEDLGLNLGFDSDKLNDPDTSAEDLQKMRKTLQSMIALAEAESVAGDKNTDITISFDEGEVDIEKEIEVDLEAYIQFQEASGIKNEPGGTGERPAMLLMENGVITPTSIVSVLNKEDGEWKERPAFAGNGFVIFATSHFSPFALVADPSTLAIPDRPNPCSFQPKNARVQGGVLRAEVTASAARTATGLAGALAAYSGTEFAGAAVTIDLTGQDKAWDGCALTLTRDALNRLKEAETRRLDLKTEQFTLSLDGAALDALYAAKGSVTLRVDRAAGLSETALSALGNRPAYRLSAESGGKAVSLFEKGDVTLSLPYDAQGSEQGGRLALAFVDAQGTASALPASVYNAEQEAVTGRADRAGVFGVAALPAPAFDDLGGHWAGDDVAFAASRGYLNGTGGSRFSPDGAMTRGMLVTVLHRLAGSPQAAGEGGAFSDVPADAYCADAARWAAQAGILNKEADAFSPEEPVTRQELAVLLRSYARAMEIDLPKLHEVAAFTDGGAIAPWARGAVRELQMAGVLQGSGGRFDPDGAFTRAQFAAVLRRFTALAK